jgi:hydrogenase maturation protein HypF
MIEARRLLVTGIVQGVGFRPFVAREANRHHLSGWVLNGPHGVEIHVEGRPEELDAFEAALRARTPPAAHVTDVGSEGVASRGLSGFRIRSSDQAGRPTVRVAPDLAICGECLHELFDAKGRRFEYPYINCTNCGPRYTIVRSLPYDRERTTMAAWPLCPDCADEYHDSLDRRFHAEPIACPACGPRYHLVEERPSEAEFHSVFARAAQMLREGAIVAIKGIGGYHLSCDGNNAAAIERLRSRKYRKSRPFAVMARDLAATRMLVEVDSNIEALLTSPARPIVLLPARASLPGVAPDHRELGVMLPYAPVHHLLFAADAPEVLVMTSANRSSDPIAFEDGDARKRLAGVADAFLVGERPIARRADDSVVRAAPGGSMVLRRGRGLAPAVVARLPDSRPILAVGPDLKNTVTLVIGGQALMSQHIGDLEYLSAYDAWRETIRDLLTMYDVNWDDVLVVHDAHPHYVSTTGALQFPARAHRAVQHHRAHVASVLAERGALDTCVLGVAFDGTGYGDDGTIWGGEMFVGSIAGGLARVASLRPFALPGGDAAARWPMQAAAGLLSDLEALPDLTAPPFSFTTRYTQARALARSGLRTFTCTSAGRLFDAAAALLGFTHQIDYEGQAAVWLENLAWRANGGPSLPFDIMDVHLDFRPTLGAMIEGRIAGDEIAALAWAFHEAFAAGLSAMLAQLCDLYGMDTVVLSGGTFQNALLVDLLRARMPHSIRLWLNAEAPPNDGGISLGQAALAAAMGV